MKKLLTLSIMLCSLISKGQIGIDSTKYSSYCCTVGLIYAPGIQWTENKKQDSVEKIFIEGDTMTAVRNLLNYCLQVKSENDNAYIILSMINLNALKKLFNDREFTFYISEYKKVVAKNKKEQLKIYNPNK